MDTIIFDLGNVLIKWDPRNLYRKIFTSDVAMEHFLKEVCTPDWNEQQDAGRSLKDATQLLLDKHPDYEIEIKAFYGRWTEMLGGSIEGTVKILRQFCDDERYRVYALTNWSTETFPIAIKQFDFLQWFEGILVSGEVKLKKPDPRIYQMMLDNYQIKAENAVFIDDSLRNVAGANALGIHGIHFKSPEQLMLDLKALNLL